MINRGRSGFTLLELMVAVFILGTLTVAVSGVLATTLRSRDRSAERLDDALVRSKVIQILERDLTQMMQPTGILAGAILGEKGESGDQSDDRIEFYTSSGQVVSGEPWGDIQKVAYYLTNEYEDGDVSESLHIAREVTRNLLPSVEEETEIDVLLEQVTSLSFTYYDGETWQDSWDSSSLDNTAPQGIQVRIEYQPSATEGATVVPIDVFFEVAAKKMDSETESTDTEEGEA